MLRLATLPSVQLPVPEASVVTWLMRQVLVPMLLVFGTGSGAPKRQPLRFPVHVPGGLHVPIGQSASLRHGERFREPPRQNWQSPSLRHGKPAREPPTQTLYSGSVTLAEVQVRLVAPSARVGGPGRSAPVVGPHIVILMKEDPISG